MTKEMSFPYWNDLERVIAAAAACTASDIKLTVVSVEVYQRHGALVTLNVEASGPSVENREVARGWLRLDAVDAHGARYSSALSGIEGVSLRKFFGRTVAVIRRPHMVELVGSLSLTVDTIEWDYLDGNETQPSTAVVSGPWGFVLDL